MDTAPAPLRDRLIEKIAESLAASLLEATRRRVHGRVALPNKATAVIGVRRAGKTTFLHQPTWPRWRRASSKLKGWITTSHARPRMAVAISRERSAADDPEKTRS